MMRICPEFCTRLCDNLSASYLFGRGGVVTEDGWQTELLTARSRPPASGR